MPAEGYRSLIGGHPDRLHREAETERATLSRLCREAEECVERLTIKVASQPL
jgi:hypothetical protein